MSIERLLQTFLQRYAVGEAKSVAPFLVGRRVLDLGAGEGYVGVALLSPGGVWTCSADVGTFGRALGPYVIHDGLRLPFRDAAFDTTLTLLTLHHCEYPDRILDEAVRVTRERLIIIESLYRNRPERFWLDLLDHRLNRYRHHGGMNVPVSFRRPESGAACSSREGFEPLRPRGSDHGGSGWFTTHSSLSSPSPLQEGREWEMPRRNPEEPGKRVGEEINV